MVELEAWRGCECRFCGHCIMNKTMKFLDSTLFLHVLPRLILAKPARSFSQFEVPATCDHSPHQPSLTRLISRPRSIAEPLTHCLKCQDLALVTGKFAIHRPCLPAHSQTLELSFANTQLTSSREQNKEATCYVGNLDERVSVSLVTELMTQFGRVQGVHLPIDRVNGSHQGYGFVEFKTEEDAEYAAKIANGIRLHGKAIRVNKASADKQKTVEIGAELFIGNLDTMVDEKSLYDTFSRFGPLLSPPKASSPQFLPLLLYTNIMNRSRATTLASPRATASSPLATSSPLIPPSPTCTDST